MATRSLSMQPRTSVALRDGAQAFFRTYSERPARMMDLAEGAQQQQMTPRGGAGAGAGSSLHNDLPGLEVEAHDEVLIKIPGAVVHLIDDHDSPMLAAGEFALVRVDHPHYGRGGGGMSAYIRVGEQLRWPLNRGEPVVKLDSTYYVFTVPDPYAILGLDRPPRDPQDEQDGEDVLNCGVALPAHGHDSELRELDQMLHNYSNFSTEVWRTMSPNPEDYDHHLAKGLASGTGAVIRGLFSLKDLAVARLQNGTLFIKYIVGPNPYPSQINPATLNTLKSVRNMSMATEDAAKRVLDIVMRFASFISNPIMRSRPGQQFFKLPVGEVALVTLDSISKIMDAMENVGTDLLQTTSSCTQDLVAYRFGPGAGEATEEVMSTIGFVFATVWTATKLRKALTPSNLKPTRKGMLKAAAKASLGRPNE